MIVALSRLLINSRDSKALKKIKALMGCQCQSLHCKLQHSHWTIIRTVLVAGLPITLSAVHLYFLASCLLMSVNVLLKTLLSESLVHVMFGVGFPSARYFRVTFPPSVTVWFPEISAIVDGTAKQQE